jgi:sterol desaturase/sphingolipid hydroxylase (fatty acid hydroxylase superfamily)
MLITVTVLALALIMMMLEAWRPGRSWPKVAGWWSRAILLNGLQVLIVFTAGRFWDGWMMKRRLWSLDGLGLWGGALAGYLVVTFVYYWWHRWRHEVDFLWRWIHQVHHSPQRIEIITSFYKHPAEILLNGLLSSAIVYWLVGLGPAAGTLAVVFTGIAELFYHWNVATPHWLGCFIQRPESHCVHHEAGLHSYNYGDLPLWDMLFGTYRNPRRWQARCGFGPDIEPRLLPMLLGRDLSRPAARHE